MMAQEVIGHTGLLLTLEESHGVAEAFAGASSTLDDTARAFAAIETLLFDDALEPLVLESVLRLARLGIEAQAERFAPLLSELYDRLKGNIDRDLKRLGELMREEADRKAQEGTTDAA